MTSQASFYDISNIVLTPKKGYCSKNEIIHIYSDKKLIKQYIIDNNLKFGDIIYYGGNGDRLEYYFGIVTENGNFLKGDEGYYIIFKNENKTVLQKIKDLNISYDNVLKEIKNDEFFGDLFFAYNNDEYDSIIQDYHDNNLI
jgi:hypothetical protein